MQAEKPYLHPKHSFLSYHKFKYPSVSESDSISLSENKYKIIFHVIGLLKCLTTLSPTGIIYAEIGATTDVPTSRMFQLYDKSTHLRKLPINKM